MPEITPNATVCSAGARRVCGFSGDGDVRAFVDRCMANDFAPMTELCGLIEAVALGPIKKVLRANNLGAESANDVVQELQVLALKAGSDFLSHFRGTTEADLRKYLRGVAHHLACKWLRKWQQPPHGESSVLESVRATDREGPTEAQVFAVLNELYDVMCERDRHKLETIQWMLHGRLIGQPSAGSPPEAVSKRTLQRYCLELRRKYGDRI
jgi:hypothetical protein